MRIPTRLMGRRRSRPSSRRQAAAKGWKRTGDRAVCTDKQPFFIDVSVLFIDELAYFIDEYVKKTEAAAQHNHEKHRAAARATRLGVYGGNAPDAYQVILCASAHHDRETSAFRQCASRQKRSEFGGHSTESKGWQTLGNCTKGKQPLRSVAAQCASRQKRRPWRLPLSRA